MYIILKSSIIKLSASFKHSSNYYWMLYPVQARHFPPLNITLTLLYMYFKRNNTGQKHYNINAYDKFVGTVSNYLKKKN